jgi:uncharacterized protein (TIGR02246 family)
MLVSCTVPFLEQGGVRPDRDTVPFSPQGSLDGFTGATVQFAPIGRCGRVGSAIAHREREQSMSKNDTQSMVRRLADLEAIRDLARRYAHCIWQKDAAGAAGLFTEDCVMDTGQGPPIETRAALQQSYEQVLPMLELQPFVHNHVVELDGDTASGHCYLDLRATMGGKSMIGSGHYDDAYVCIGGEWKFSSRKLRMRFLVPLDEGWAGPGSEQ